ncbi:hypothetical protein [Ktedonobacter racemifer]|uniref:hypothetical protein n=1 Tax=Ktedonobacter racemifer TaxID=363277 RepID=UPI00058AC61F|nr:hypothetical protein [Ktedonobacter racemifer]
MPSKRARTRVPGERLTLASSRMGISCRPSSRNEARFAGNPGEGRSNTSQTQASVFTAPGIDGAGSMHLHNLHIKRKRGGWSAWRTPSLLYMSFMHVLLLSSRNQDTQGRKGSHVFPSWPLICTNW